MGIIEIGKNVIIKEIEVLQRIHACLDDTFERIVECIVSCEGKVILTGMGKSGHVARKISATMSSLGIPSFFMHPGEAMHGDLGMVQKQDFVIAISYSGESDEIVKILPNIKIKGALLAGITCNSTSTLSKSCEIIQIFPTMKEACHLGLAPTCSTTAVLAYGDALAVAASHKIGFTKKDFGLNHPAGSLGKKLIIKVRDLMTNFSSHEYLSENMTIQQSLLTMCKDKKNILPVMDGSKNYKGIVTFEALENKLNSNCSGNELIKSLDVKKPVNFVLKEDMAIDALQVLKSNNLSEIVVTLEDLPVGIISAKEIEKIGIYL